MEVKTYRVHSMPEALQLILTDLGPEAAVLHARQLEPPRWQFWRRPAWEVIAAHDPSIPDQFQACWDDPALASQGWEPTRADYVDAQPTFARSPASDPVRSNTRGDVTLPPALPAAGIGSEMTWGGIRSHLLAAGAATAAVHRLILDLGQALGETVTWDLKPVPTWGKLVEQMGQLIDFAGALAPEPKRCLKLALVGPTGVGKTTTIAKLAADYHLRQGLRVGLVTMDTFRVGGVDQLQAYAQILDLPVQVVTSPAEMQHAISRFADCDVVLIDSTGRSPRDSARIQHLHSILQAAHVDHLLLTLSATHDLASLRRAAAEFRPLGSDIPTSLILTKVDEVQNLAHLYPMLTDLQIPWRYWTNGQNVPEDLGVADPDVVTWFLDEVAAPLSAGVSSHE